MQQCFSVLVCPALPYNLWNLNALPQKYKHKASKIHPESVIHIAALHSGPFSPMIVVSITSVWGFALIWHHWKMVSDKRSSCSFIFKNWLLCRMFESFKRHWIPYLLMEIPKTSASSKRFAAESLRELEIFKYKDIQDVSGWSFPLRNSTVVYSYFPGLNFNSFGCMRELKVLLGTKSISHCYS